MHETFSAPIKNPHIPEKLIEFLNAYSTFIIAGHKEPDGDCIGSSLALASFLKRRNKKVILMSAGPFLRTEIKQYEPLFLPKLPAGFDGADAGLIIVDCTGFDRLGSIEDEVKRFPYIIIDHHATNTNNSDCFFDYARFPFYNVFGSVHYRKNGGNGYGRRGFGSFFRPLYRYRFFQAS